MTTETVTNTETVTISGKTYTLAPLNFDQWEQAFYDSQGNPLRRPRTGFVVQCGLGNASADNPDYLSIPAGHILKLLPTVLRLSDLERDDQREAKTAEDPA